MKSIQNLSIRIGALLVLSGMLVAGCSSASPAPTPTLPPPTPLPTDTPHPTATPEPTPTVPRTPPALPPLYASSALASGVTPHIYINDVCQYLNLKWDPNNAEPGTVVMVVMFHGIVHGAQAYEDDIGFNEFNQMADDLNSQGFVGITAEQLADFLEHNAKIPPRSVVFIADDRHYADYFNRNFRPIWKKYGWPVVNAWISHPETIQILWEENEALEQEGWVDHQAHGVIHNIIATENSTDEFLLNELNGSIAAIQEHYGKTPVAYIWPGGGFTARAAELAREVGYRIGFTINSRGPVMFNWVPLADQRNPNYPLALPEGPAQNPLMVLPRYWPIEVSSNIDKVRVMGKEAAEYAAQVRDTELEFYEIVCEPYIGPIPELAADSN